MGRIGSKMFYRKMARNKRVNKGKNAYFINFNPWLRKAMAQAIMNPGWTVDGSMMDS